MRPNKAEHGPDPLDVHIGALVRQHRVVQGISLAALGMAVRMTYQQVQKYENGENRISATMLWKLSQVLRVPVGAFFRGLKSSVSQESPVMNRDALELLRAYQAIPDDHTRRSIKMLVSSVAKQASQEASAADHIGLPPNEASQQ